MDFPPWYIPSDRASYYKDKYDSGPNSFMVRWRSLKQSNRCKPEGIPLEAWMYLAGPFKQKQRVVVGKVVGKKPKSKGCVQAITPALGPGGGVPSWPKQDPGGHHYTSKTITDISADCLQLLIDNGYEKAQAHDLVKRCRDLISTLYDIRPQVVRRLTLPDEPTKRCRTLKKWVEQILMNHPPSKSTDCL